MQEGWIKVYRDIFKHWIFDDAEYFKAWLFIVGNTAFEDTKQKVGKKIITVKRGEFVTSESYLCKQLNIGRTKLRTLLSNLVTENMITKGLINNKTRLKVVNYEIYQERQTEKKQVSDNEQTENEQQTNSDQTDTVLTKEECKEVKEVKNNMSGSDAEVLLNCLNIAAHKGFKPIENNLRPIRARLKEYSKTELAIMIDVKVKEWKNNPKMKKYLRPETLFNATKCASYIEQSRNTGKSEAETEIDYEKGSMF